jgi:hypothetical protein
MPVLDKYAEVSSCVDAGTNFDTMTINTRGE